MPPSILIVFCKTVTWRRLASGSGTGQEMAARQQANYLTIIMNSPYGNDYASGNMSSLGASAGNFNLGRIRLFPIPFPPLAEQKEIVSKVNQLMAWCDELEKKIEKRDAYQERIMQAVVMQAI